MKVGVYGGTFDPVHIGHLILAETVREKLDLDEVWFIPAYQNPLKADAPVTPTKSRLEMLRFAIAGNAAFKLQEMEIKRKEPSFTCDTLQRIREAQPEVELHLLIGADSLSDFPRWKSPDLILDLAKLVVVNRGLEQPEIPTGIDPERVCLLDMPAIEVSASDIRRRRREGSSIRYLTPRSVELFINANQLYLDTMTVQ